MDNKQRLRLVKACADDYQYRYDDDGDVFYHKRPRTVIHHNGLIITIDYEDKHGTGSGQVTGIEVAGPNDQFSDELSNIIDLVLLDWARTVSKEKQDDYQLVKSSIDAILNRTHDSYHGQHDRD